MATFNRFHHRPTRQYLILAVIYLIAIFSSVVSAHYADPRVASFTIPVKTGLTKQTVQVAAEKAKAICEFQYSTTEVAPEAPKEVAPKEPEPPRDAGNVRSVMDALKETCVSKRVDYWEYEVCLGGNVRQFHNPDSYSLGSFSRWEGDDQIYDKGQVCSARPDNAPRQVKVTFGCLKGADAPRAALVSIAETQICMYTAVIGTPLACSFSQFPVVTDVPTPVSAPPPPMSFDDGSEDWFLQLSELADGRFICSALSNEARATGSKLAFTKIEMSLRVENLPLPAGVPAESAHQYLARRPGRGLLKAKEFQPSYKTEQNVRETVVKSSSDFEGKLAFVKVFA